ncbi:MAG: hypothetical protein U5R06_12250 [candidate division KSB1 bacterium]|nr:hypothetical protein [candidate division KSB1 bacterium]
MGITIHFSGILKNTDLITELVDELSDIADIMDWPYQILDEDWSKPCTAEIADGGITGHLPLKGISIQLHPASESLTLFFDPQGRLTSPITLISIKQGELNDKEVYNFVKTQFAPPDLHISIVKLLRFLKKKYIPDLQVIDEGEYWETGDRDRLIEKMQFLQNKLDQLQQTVSTINPDHALLFSPDQLAQLIEKKLKNL